MPGDEPIRFDGPRAASFATTHWSVVLAASQPGTSSHDEALAVLCRTYWPPVYTYIRRRGNPPQDAQDLTQEFFARLLEKRWLEGIEPEGSRFRSFLLTAVARFLANEHDRARALKRGGGLPPIPFDEAEPLCRDSAERGDSPERAYDRRWALTLLDQALHRLRHEVAATGRARQFERLDPFLSREALPDEYAALGRELGLSPGAIGVAVHRLRHRYRQLVRLEVTRTLADPRLADEELRHLFAALQSGGP